MLLVPADAVRLDELHEAPGPVGAQRVPREAGVLRQETLRPVGVDVGEVAAPAARDADLLGQAHGMVDQGDLQAALRGDAGAEQSGRAGADNDRVESLSHEPSWAQAPGSKPASLAQRVPDAGRRRAHPGSRAERLQHRGHLLLDRLGHRALAGQHRLDPAGGGRRVVRIG